MIICNNCGNVNSNGISNCTVCGRTLYKDNTIDKIIPNGISPEEKRADVEVEIKREISRAIAYALAEEKRERSKKWLKTILITFCIGVFALIIYLIASNSSGADDATEALEVYFNDEADAFEVALTVMPEPYQDYLERRPSKYRQAKASFDNIHTSRFEVLSTKECSKAEIEEYEEYLNDVFAQWYETDEDIEVTAVRIMKVKADNADEVIAIFVAYESEGSWYLFKDGDFE